MSEHRRGRCWLVELILIWGRELRQADSIATRWSVSVNLASEAVPLLKVRILKRAALKREQEPGRWSHGPCSSSRALRDTRLIDCQTVICDGIDKDRNKPGREIVTHPRYDRQFGT